MAKIRGDSIGKPAVPPPQHNFREAAERAAADARGQSPEQLQWLGARPAGDDWHLPVLEDLLLWQPQTGCVQTSAGEPVGPFWQVLTLHYLGVGSQPLPAEPAVTFADLPDGRAYAPVYQGRVIRRLCGTVGRSEDALRQAAAALTGHASPAAVAPPADLAVDFQVYPRVAIRLLWHAGDEELPPSATLLLPPNIESFFCVEDIVVLSERLVSRLAGGSF